MWFPGLLFFLSLFFLCLSLSSSHILSLKPGPFFTYLYTCIYFLPMNLSLFCPLSLPPLYQIPLPMSNVCLTGWGTIAQVLIKIPQLGNVPMFCWNLQLVFFSNIPHRGKQSKHGKTFPIWRTSNTFETLRAYVETLLRWQTLPMWRLSYTV